MRLFYAVCIALLGAAPVLAQPAPPGGEWVRSIAQVVRSDRCSEVRVQETRLKLSWLRAGDQFVPDGVLMVGVQTIPLVLGCEPRATAAAWGIGGRSSEGALSLRAVLGECVQGVCDNEIALGSKDLTVQLDASGLAAVDGLDGAGHSVVLMLEIPGGPSIVADEYRAALRQRRSDQKFPAGADVAIMRQALLAPTEAGFEGFFSLSRISYGSGSVLTEIALVEGPSHAPRNIHYWLL